MVREILGEGEKLRKLGGTRGVFFFFTNSPMDGMIMTKRNIRNGSQNIYELVYIIILRPLDLIFYKLIIAILVKNLRGGRSRDNFGRRARTNCVSCYFYIFKCSKSEWLSSLVCSEQKSSVLVYSTALYTRLIVKPSKMSRYHNNDVLFSFFAEIMRRVGAALLFLHIARGQRAALGRVLIFWNNTALNLFLNGWYEPLSNYNFSHVIEQYGLSVRKIK